MDMSVPRTRAEWNEIVKTWHKDGFGKSQMGTLIKEMQEKNKPSGKEKELLEMQFMHKYKNFFTGSGLDQYSEEDRHGADNYANMLKALNVFKRY